MRQHCEREVVELHQFFEDWFCGLTDAFERVEAALADNFVLISPRGEMRTREKLLEDLRVARGCRRGDPFEIRIEACEVRAVEFGLALVTFEEWQRLGEREAGRVSTALFRVDREAPCGVRWMHLHETWLPGNANLAL